MLLCLQRELRNLNIPYQRSTARRFDEVKEHRDRRAFTGTVGTEDDIDFAIIYFHVQFIDG